jgi:putative RecB family exonuclease
MDRQLRALWSAIDRAIDEDKFPTRVGRLCDWCSFQEICPAFATTPEPDRILTVA